MQVKASCTMQVKACRVHSAHTCKALSLCCHVTVLPCTACMLDLPRTCSEHRVCCMNACLHTNMELNAKWIMTILGCHVFAAGHGAVVLELSVWSQVAAAREQLAGMQHSPCMQACQPNMLGCCSHGGVLGLSMNEGHDWLGKGLLHAIMRRLQGHLRPRLYQALMPSVYNRIL
jgi:hypothetical protein